MTSKTQSGDGDDIWETRHKSMSRCLAIEVFKQFDAIAQIGLLSICEQSKNSDNSCLQNS